jgi:hypothetical protein
LPRIRLVEATDSPLGRQNDQGIAATCSNSTQVPQKWVRRDEAYRHSSAAKSRLMCISRRAWPIVRAQIREIARLAIALWWNAP